MNDPSTSRALPPPPLDLPAAALHAHSRALKEPHPDCEDAVRYERQRVAKELEPVRRKRATPPNEAHATPSLASLRSRNTSLTSEENASRSELGRYASTQADVPEQTGHSTSDISKPRFYDPIVKFWTTQISLTMDEGSHRDHLALERTFLGYLRTSLLLVVTGVITAQLFYLQHHPHPNPQFGFYRIGKPLSVIFIGMGIVVVLLGAIRCWRLQRALVKGKAIAGGWEVNLIMGLVGALLLGTFGLVLGVDIEKG